MSLMSMFPGGGGTQNQPLKAPTNLHAGMNTVTSVAITWTDPENEYAQPSGILIGEWMFTRIVRKEGSAPVNANDGILIVESAVKNQYQTTPFVDTNGIVTGKTYYYAAFAFTTSRVSSPAATYQIVATWYDPVLNNNSWTMINQAIVEGVAQDIWSAGAKKTDGSGITFTLLGHFPTQYPLSDGDGYPPMVFSTDRILTEVTYSKSNQSSESGASNYKASQLKVKIDSYYNSLSEELRSFLRPVNVTLYNTSSAEITVPSLYTFPLGQINLTSLIPTAAQRIRKYGGKADLWWTGDGAPRRYATSRYEAAARVVTHTGAFADGEFQHFSDGVVFGIAFGKVGG